MPVTGKRLERPCLGLIVATESVLPEVGGAEACHIAESLRQSIVELRIPH